MLRLPNTVRTAQKPAFPNRPTLQSRSPDEGLKAIGRRPPPKRADSNGLPSAVHLGVAGRQRYSLPARKESASGRVLDH